MKNTPTMKQVRKPIKLLFNQTCWSCSNCNGFWDCGAVQVGRKRYTIKGFEKVFGKKRLMQEWENLGTEVKQ